MTSQTRSVSRRPRRPDGWLAAKPSGVTPLRSMTVSASASATASATATLDVGASARWPASRSARASTATVACVASFERMLPTIAMTGTSRMRRYGSSASTSSVSPLLESATMTSRSPMTPSPPCSASAGWTKIAGVPVLVSVAATLRATMPETPAPTVATLPAQPDSSSTARSKRSTSRLAAAARIASASWRMSSAAEAVVSSLIASSPGPDDAEQRGDLR